MNPYAGKNRIKAGAPPFFILQARR
jgi:hypothetical protein